MHQSIQSLIDPQAAGHAWERCSASPEDVRVLKHT